jgi:hypothetical protein
MRREQFAALTWGVCLTFAAIAAVLLAMIVAGALGYCVGAWML